jgi:hypothetical protein
MPMLHFLFLTAALGAGGADARDEERSRAKEPEQGVTGVVVALKGNFMPGIGGRPGGSRTPLAVPLHVFRGKLGPFEKLDAKHPAPLKTVRASAKGEYRVALAPGEYTVVAEIGGKLYLNLQQMDQKTRKAVWASIVVSTGNWLTWNIEDTSQAAF